MKKIILIVLVILIARSCLSQFATPSQYNETSDSYIIGGTTAVLGSMIVIMVVMDRSVAAIEKKSPLEITPQAGPSINWMSPDQNLSQFFQDYGVSTGSIWGYSAGAMLTFRRGVFAYKSGLFSERKGGSYSMQSQSIMTDSYGTPKLVSLDTKSISRLSYLTIPLTIGVQTRDTSRPRVSFDLGGFISLPISESHQTTTNGIPSTFDPIHNIGPDAGLLADAGIKFPISDIIGLAIDARFLSSISDAMKLQQIGKSFNQSFQLLFGLNIKIN
jgi:hypothetical protein